MKMTIPRQNLFNRGISNEMFRNNDDACADWQKAADLGIEQAKDYLKNCED